MEDISRCRSCRASTATWVVLSFPQVHFQLKQDMVKKAPERKASGTRTNNKTLQKKVVPRSVRRGTQR